MNYDAIVIGAGVNGLVTAHRLARAGRRVLVLDRRESAHDGLDEGWIPGPVVAGLGLTAAGLTISRPDPWLSIALPDGGRLDLSADIARTADAIRRLSPADAERWPEFCARMRVLGSVLEALYTRPAPDIETRSPVELLQLAELGLRVRRLGRQAVIDLLRVMPMSVATLLDEWFENDALKAGLGAAGIRHLRQGPRSGGTAFTMVHHHAGSAAGMFRPPLSNIGRVLAGRPGVELQRGVAVERITVEGGRATGVVAGGETHSAPVVASSADPRATLLGLVAPGWIDPELARAVRNIKCRGVAAEVTLRLSRPAPFTTLAVAPSLEYLERAYDDAKYGRVSADPYVEARAEDGRVVVHVQYAPYALADGAWDEDRRRALGDLVVRRLAAHAPELAAAITDRTVLTPKDLEDRDGLTEGHRYHGELTLDQVLFARPVAGWSRHRTPVTGLYLCGSGTHPGGAVQGGAGWLAAREILRDGR